MSITGTGLLSLRRSTTFDSTASACGVDGFAPVAEGMPEAGVDHAPPGSMPFFARTRTW